MKKFIWVALAVCVFSVSSYAQQGQQGPRADISGGYSFLRVGGTNGANLNGFNTSFAYNANAWLGLAGDVGVYHASPGGVSVTAFSYTFGPRFTYRRGDLRFMPFAEALFGASHASASAGGFSGSSNPFTYVLGGGAEIPLGSTHNWAIRPEAEYLGLRANGATANCVRISAGIVYHFGLR